MKKLAISSPRPKSVWNIRLNSPLTEKDLLILDLQSKLQDLEEKYSKFIEKCSGILRAEELKSDLQNSISEESSVNCRLDLPGDHEKLVCFLKDIESDGFLKDSIKKVTRASDRTQETLLLYFNSQELTQDKIKRTLNSFKRTVWEVLIEKQDFVKLAVSACLKRFSEFRKFLDSTLKTFKEKRLKKYKEKSLKILEENFKLSRKNEEICEDLRKLKEENFLLRGSDGLQSATSRRALSSEKFLTINTSPGLERNVISSLREQNKVLNSKLRILSQQNSVLQKSQRSSTNTGIRSDFSDSVELKEHLQNLKNRISGFQKIAENLFEGKSIKSERKERIVRLKNKGSSSETFSPIALLEIDQIQKKLEEGQKEKSLLEEVLKSEKNKREKILKDFREKEERCRMLEKEIEELNKKNLENDEKQVKILKANEDLENKVKGEGVWEAVDEKSKKYEERTAELEDKMKELKKIVYDLEEDKLKLGIIVKKYEDNEKKVGEKNRFFKEKIRTSEEALAQSEQEIKRLNEKIKNIEIDSENKAKGLEDFKRTMEITKNELSKLKLDYESHRKTTENITSEKNKVIVSLELKNQENLQLSEEIKNLSNIIQEDQSKISKLTYENEIFLEKNTILFDTVNSQEKLIESSELENKETSKKIKILTDSLNDLKNLMKDTANKLKISEENNKKLLIINEKFQDKLKNLQDELRNIELNKSKIDQQENLNRLSHLDAEKKQIENSLMTELNKKNSEVQELSQKIARLKENLEKDQQENESKVLKSESKAGELSKEIEKKNRDIEYLQSLVLELENSNKDLRFEKGCIEEKVLELDEKSKNSDLELSKTKEELDLIKSENEEKNKKIQDLQEDLKWMSESNSKDLEKNEEIASKNEIMLKEITQKLQDSEFSLLESKKKIEILAEENKATASREKNLEGLVEKLNKENLKITGHLTEYKLTMSKFKSLDFQELKKKISQLCSGFNQDLVLVSQNILKYLKENEAGISGHSNLLSEISEINKEKQQIFEIYIKQQEKMEQVLIEHTTLKGKLTKLETESFRTPVPDNNNIELLDKLNSSLQKVENLKKINKELAIELERYKKTNFETQSINEKMMHRLMKFETSSTEMESNLEMFTVKLQEKNNQIDLLTKEVESFKFQVSETKDSEKQLELKKKEVFKISQENHLLNSKIEQKNKIIEELSKTASLQKYEIERIQKENKSCRDDLIKNQEFLKEKEDNIKDLKLKIKELETLFNGDCKKEFEISRGNEKLMISEDDINEIKAALGDYYNGSVVKAIEILKEIADHSGGTNGLSKNENIDLASQSFRCEIIESGLDLSKIEESNLEYKSFEQLYKELSTKVLEIQEKNLKISQKKKKISLFKDQISVLKEQLRKEGEMNNELENKIKSTMAINLDYLKQVFSNLISKVKANKNSEDLIILLYKLLDFSQEDINKLQVLRGGKAMKK